MYILRSEVDKNEEVGIQSSEDRAGVILTKDQILQFSEQYSNYVNYLIPVLSKSIKMNFGYEMPLECVEILVRRSAVPLTFCFWNQVLRVNELLKVKKDVTVVKYPSEMKTQDTPEAFEAKSTSKEWNDSILGSISKIWSLPIIDKQELIPATDSPPQKPFKNFLFFLGNSSEFKSRILIRVEDFFDKLPFISKFPVLTFANAEPALRLKGLYLFFFRRVSRSFPLASEEKNNEIRSRLLNIEQIWEDRFEVYLKTLGLSSNQIDQSFALFLNFLLFHFPIQYLEGMKTNYISASRLFKKNDRKILLSSGDGDIYSTFTIASAKGLGFKILKAQHGGHYGYYKDNRPALDIELPATDLFVTWGWTKMHEGKQLQHIKTVPLPSPWLSERKKLWKSVKKTHEYDVLWMPQMMKRFIGSPQGASSIRRDVIHEFSEMMKELGSMLNETKLKTFLKPYNKASVDLLPKAYDHLRNLPYISISENFNKGLHLDLLNKVNLVIWDQPGTGFLECLACGIPTMILWNRLYSEEEEWCKEDFFLLESVGIIHREVDTLKSEILKFFGNKNVWSENENRRTIEKQFCDKYALTHDKWWFNWIQTLKTFD